MLAKIIAEAVLGGFSRFIQVILFSKSSICILGLFYWKSSYFFANLISEHIMAADYCNLCGLQHNLSRPRNSLSKFLDLDLN